MSSRVATAAPAPGAGIDFTPLDERDAAVLRSWDHRSFARLAAAEPELASRCALLLQQWCSVLSSAIIDEGSPASRRSTGTGGLAQEVTACRERRAALAAAVEHAQVSAWGSKGQGKDGRLTARWPSDEQGGWLHALRLLFQPQAHPLPAHCWPRPPCMQSDACRCVVGMASKGAAALEWRSQQQGLGEALSDAEDCLQYLEVVQELMQGLCCRVMQTCVLHSLETSLVRALSEERGHGHNARLACSHCSAMVLSCLPSPGHNHRWWRRSWSPSASPPWKLAGGSGTGSPATY